MKKILALRIRHKKNESYSKKEEETEHMEHRHEEEEHHSLPMHEYIKQNGRTFNKKLNDFAVSKMITEDAAGDEVQLIPWGKNDVDNMLKRYGIYISNNHGYDICYCANMFKSDFLGKSLPNEQYLCIHLKCYLDDVDGNPHRAFDEYVADAQGKGVVIPWDILI